MMNIQEILNILPHRYPFLLVDRIEELIPGKMVIGYKNVTINEEFFQGHYPGHPIMPGVLIIESMAQIAGFLMMASVDNPKEKLPFFTGIDRARFRRPVIPGDRLRVKAEVIKLRAGKVGKIATKGFVEDELAAEAKIMFSIVDK